AAPRYRPAMPAVRGWPVPALGPRPTLCLSTPATRAGRPARCGLNPDVHALQTIGCRIRSEPVHIRHDAPGRLPACVPLAPAAAAGFAVAPLPAPGRGVSRQARPRREDATRTGARRSQVLYARI